MASVIETFLREAHGHIKALELLVSVLERGAEDESHERRVRWLPACLRVGRETEPGLGRATLARNMWLILSWLSLCVCAWVCLSVPVSLCPRMRSSCATTAYGKAVMPAAS